MHAGDDDAVQRPFDQCPDELVVRVLDALEPDEVVRSVALVSRRFARIAFDDGLWARFCARALLGSTTGPSVTTAAFLRDAWVPAGVPLRALWTHFLRLWTPRLGWFAETDDSHGSVYKMSANYATGSITLARVAVSNALEEAPLPPYGTLPTGVVLDRGILSIPTDPTQHTYLDIHLLQPVLALQHVFSAHFDGERVVVIYHNGRTPQDGPRDVVVKPWIALHMSSRPPFPTPVMLPTLRIPPVTQLRLDWAVRTLQLDLGPKRLVPLRSTFDDDGGPVRPGWYAGTYGSHGCEILFVQTVASPENGGLDWPWEVLPSNSPRGRRVEGIKLTGDPNVPKGQRSFVAFLPDTPATTTIPATSGRPMYAPWPTAADPRDGVLGDLADPTPSTGGITVPGVGRIAARWFRDPRWTPCLVHFASRVEIQLFWDDMGIVTTFHRFEPDDIPE